MIWSNTNEQCWIRSCILDYTRSLSLSQVRSIQEMNCWHCNTELIWGGDNDCRDITEEYSFVTNLHCPRCNSYVEVYYPRQDRDD